MCFSLLHDAIDDWDKNNNNNKNKTVNITEANDLFKTKHLLMVIKPLLIRFFKYDSSVFCNYVESLEIHIMGDFSNAKMMHDSCFIDFIIIILVGNLSKVNKNGRMQMTIERKSVCVCVHARCLQCVSVVCCIDEFVFSLAARN